MVRSLYFTDRKLYYLKKMYSARALKGWETRREKEKIIKVSYFRSLIQVRFKGHKKKDAYDFMKIRVWINDISKHDEQELRAKLREIDEKLDIRFGVGIGRGNVTYDVAFECEEIAKHEADEIGEYQYYVDIKGWEDEGTI